ncbi:MAG: FAD-dependent oxidoreductase, partial [Nakamurella sp.]
MRRTDVLVIGAGQAGLSAAHHLARTGTDHLVVDAEVGPGGAWRHRWESLTMETVNGIRELPGSVVPEVSAAAPAKVAIPAYFADYEQRNSLRVQRPVTIRRVESAGRRLRAVGATGEEYSGRALINATGTWNRPFRPFYPGRELFAGPQWHAKD